MHIIARYGMPKLLLGILRKPHQTANCFDMKDKNGRTPLSWAAENGHQNIAQLLVDEGVNIDTKDQFGRTPLSDATIFGHKNVVQLLVDKSGLTSR
jgi:ankyrin repeat protein